MSSQSSVPAVVSVVLLDEPGALGPATLERCVMRIEAVDPQLRRMVREEWRADDGSTALVAWSTAADDATGGPSAIARGPKRWVGAFSGCWSSPATPFEAALHGRGEGNFSCSVAAPRRIVARTSRSGTEPLYVGHDGARVVVANRARVANIALSDGAVQFDLDAVPEFLSAGYALSDRTFYRGVTALEPGVRFVARRPRFRDVRVRTEPEGSPTAITDPQELASSLIGAVAPLRGEGEVLLSLTGGKDSRLVAAALAASAIPFRAQTSGWDGDADVVVAAQVARHLGIEHTSKSPATKVHDGRSSIEVDLLARAVNAIRLGEGHVSSYENLGKATSINRSLVGLGGAGGEVIRGGYAHYTANVTPEGAAAYLKQAFLRVPQLFHDDSRHALQRQVLPWLASAKETPLETLDELYRRFRVARWSATARSAYEQTRRKIQPFFDSRLMRASEGADRAACVDERTVFQVLDLIDPELARLPFAGSRYRFEREGPHPILPDGWEARAPIQSTGGPGVSGFNWRVGYGDEVQEVFREVILDPARDADLYLHVRRDRVEHMLSVSPPTSQHLTWHLFTLAVLFSRVWEEPTPPSRVVTVTAPANL